MSDTAAEIRDRAIAENGLLRQHNAELRAGLRNVCGHLEIVSSVLPDGSIGRSNADAAVARARALLAKVVP